MAQAIDPNSYTYPFQLTKTIHRDPYPFLSPEAPGNSQKGKIIVITGGGSGIGKVSCPMDHMNSLESLFNLLPGSC